MEATFKHSLVYSNKHNIAITDVAESLLGNETLMIMAGELIGKSVPGLYVQGVHVKFAEAIHSSPLRELFLGTLVFTFQEELNQEVPNIITALTGIEVSDKYDTLLTVAVLILSFYGADYLYRRFVSDKKPKAITENRENLLYVAGDYFNISQDNLREAVEETTKGIRTPC